MNYINTLEEKITEAINKIFIHIKICNDDDEIKIDGQSEAAKACNAITIEFAKGLLDFIGSKEYMYFENPQEGFKWITPNGNLDDYKDTDELITAYINTLK